MINPVLQKIVDDGHWRMFDAVESVIAKYDSIREDKEARHLTVESGDFYRLKGIYDPGNWASKAAN